MVSTSEIDAQLKRFWEIGEIPDGNKSTEEEESCEHHYASTHKRLADGRYMVKIPFKNSEIADIGESRSRTFLQTERKFQRDNNYFGDYKKFIDEYISLGRRTYHQRGFLCR